MRFILYASTFLTVILGSGFPAFAQESGPVPIGLGGWQKSDDRAGGQCSVSKDIDDGISVAIVKTRGAYALDISDAHKDMYLWKDYDTSITLPGFQKTVVVRPPEDHRFSIPLSSDAELFEHLRGARGLGVQFEERRYAVEISDPAALFAQLDDCAPGDAGQVVSQPMHVAAQPVEIVAAEPLIAEPAVSARYVSEPPVAAVSLPVVEAAAPVVVPAVADDASARDALMAVKRAEVPVDAPVMDAPPSVPHIEAQKQVFAQAQEQAEQTALSYPDNVMPAAVDVVQEPVTGDGIDPVEAVLPENEALRAFYATQKPDAAASCVSEEQYENLVRKIGLLEVEKEKLRKSVSVGEAPGPLQAVTQCAAESNMIKMLKSELTLVRAEKDTLQSRVKEMEDAQQVQENSSLNEALSELGDAVSSDAQ